MRPKRFSCCCLICLFILIKPVYGQDFDTVIEAFEKDFNLENPVVNKDRLISIIKELSGMKIGHHVDIVYKSRGDVKQESLDLDLNRLDISDEKSLLGYEHLLKSLNLLKPDLSLREFLLKSQYDNIAGFYDPGTKQIVIMDGADRELATNILFHELVHAAQDSYIDLTGFYEKNPKNIDASLAASSLVEGQAYAVELLVQVMQNLGDKTPEEILKGFAEQMPGELHYQPDEKIDFLTTFSAFPYFYGIKHVLQNYIEDDSNNKFIKMFDPVPASSEQLLHRDKYTKNEMPIETLLQSEAEALASKLDHDLLFHTSLGEFFIKEVFYNNLEDKIGDNTKASSGWGGDYIAVLQRSKKVYFIWDTLWDEAKDAEEFYERYFAFSRKRSNGDEPGSDKKFNSIFVLDNSNILLSKSGKRVIIIEGDITPSELNLLINILKI